ncbi:tetratricopeptide repeat protein [Leeuwenhoekiella marinoflava]|uniref:Peptidase S41-like protein n=2 Tax=Leeuwenhoekiella marinoflava TaxID=988 RepID=A0A4Q0PBR2_9FLAO|nr:S41 family peptidase [Leeuwenhoekiella marinoflava]RXG24145.1 peptidase S41-like protein [Leeuwenhoekiella marinoflava]SHF98925.1 Peptidase family S41 [Leeuwenhoekiella marinoflava DSM 3653]
MVKLILFILNLFLALQLSAQEKLSETQWQEDLRFFQNTLHEDYPFLFVKTTPEAFDKEVQTLYDDIPNLQEHEIIVGISRLVASFKYGHTHLSFWQKPVVFAQFPFNLYAFKDGIYMEGTHKDYPEAVGAKVLAVAGTPIAEALQAIEPTVPAENAQYFKAYGINNLRYPEIVHAQHLTQNLQQEITLKLEKNGKVFNQTFTALPKGAGVPTDHGFVTPDENWLSARDQNTTPLYLQQLDKVYVVEFLAGEQAVYVRHSRIQDEPEESTKDFYARVLEEVVAKNAQKLIIDLRLNGGGNNYLNKDIIKELLQTEQINQLGKLFVIIGKRTFSACQNLVNELDNYTNVIFVGEPTAENLNFWGDNRPVTLPNSGIEIAVSYLWWQDKPALENAEWMNPSLPVAMTFEEYRTNQDPVLEAALAFDEPDFKPRPMDYVKELYFSGQTHKLAEELPKMIQDPLYAFCDFENELIKQGNLLLQSGRGPQLQAAIQVFATVLNLFPDSANAYKHLGESYIAIGNTQKAKEVLNKAVALDPNGVGVAAQELLAEI